MTTARKTARPPGYAEIEQALFELDVGESGRWIAARLQNVANPAAQEAVALLRARECAAARAGLEAELLRLAGPESGEALSWFSPATEPVRDERRRPW
jgi:hypothetical protein